MSFLNTVLAFVVALGVLIVVHEYGHYLAARLCNVKVLRFSVGFGRPLATWRSGRDRTEWVIAAVPFGGYVKMLDEREAPVPAEEQARAFNRQGVGRRLAIVAAGPVFNFLFAIAVYAALYMVGLPEARPVVAEPPPATLARAAGLHAGDLVREAGGQPVATWQELRWRVLQAALQREALALEVIDERSRISQLTLDLTGFPGDDVESDLMERIGLRLYRPALPAVLGQVVSGSAAERAGLRPGDRVTHADGRALANWDELVQTVRRRPGQPLRLTVERAGAADRRPPAGDSGTARGVRAQHRRVRRRRPHVGRTGDCARSRPAARSPRCRGRAVRRDASRLPRALRGGEGVAPRRRPDALDDRVGGPTPGLRRRRRGRPLHRRRRQRLRRLLPRGHWGDDGPRPAADGRGDRRAGGAGDHADAAD